MKVFAGLGLVLSLIAFMSCTSNPASRDTSTDDVRRVMTNETGNSTELVQDQASTQYTAEDVAKHNNKSDCWLIVNNGVYNVTSFIGEHPGGPGEIIKHCGQDISSLSSEHPGGPFGSPRVQEELAPLKVGDLAQ